MYNPQYLWGKTRTGETRHKSMCDACIYRCFAIWFCWCCFASCFVTWHFHHTRLFMCTCLMLTFYRDTTLNQCVLAAVLDGIYTDMSAVHVVCFWIELADFGIYRKTENGAALIWIFWGKERLASVAKFSPIRMLSCRFTCAISYVQLALKGKKKSKQKKIKKTNNNKKNTHSKNRNIVFGKMHNLWLAKT